MGANDAHKSRIARRYKSSIRDEDDNFKHVLNFIVDGAYAKVPFRLTTELRNDEHVRALSVLTEDGPIEIGTIVSRFGKINRTKKTKRFSHKVWRFACEAARIMAGADSPALDAPMKVREYKNETFKEPVFTELEPQKVLRVTRSFNI